MITFPSRLVEGYQTFMQGRFRTEQERYRSLAETGQKPEIMVIGCCDSRVSPEAIFDAKPGELFVMRNVANLVPPCENDTGYYHGTSAAIEFAVQALRVKHIVVLGHAQCGGIRAVVEPGEPLSPGNFIGKWTSQIQHLAQRVGPPGPTVPEMIATLRKVELAVIEHSLEMLMTFACIKELVNRGKLQLHGAYFAVATGRLLVRDATTGEFLPCPSFLS